MYKIVCIPIIRRYLTGMGIIKINKRIIRNGTVIFHLVINVLNFIAEKIWEGETLFLEKVSRLNMGAFLCVASNGIRPSISQRVQLKVQCKVLFSSIYLEYYKIFKL